MIQGDGEGKGVVPGTGSVGFEIALLCGWAISVVALSALLHEFGHAWAARALGWRVVGLRWRWYGVALVADPNGRTDALWKVALGGLSASALLALVFLAGTGLPDPAPFIFGLGFTVNGAILLSNLVPLPMLDGGQVLTGIRRVRAR